MTPHTLAGALGLLAAVPAAAQQAATGTVSVTAAVVLENFQVRPLPLFRLELVRVADTTTRIAFVTGLDGKATQAAPPGEYRLRSVEPAVLGDRRYSWDLPAVVVAARTMVAELTNTNATVDSAKATGRQLAPEMAVYGRVQGGVLRIQAGLKQGSGFVLDTLGGVVITNAHVIEGESEISVFTDSTTRVAASVVVRDADEDLAVLKLAPEACAQCTRLRLASPDSAGAVAVPGERVIAIGFPLHQPSTLTSGIISNVREGVVFTDAAINPGNSGGPLLNMGGAVVAVNTFGAQAERGPGMGGAILATRLLPLLARSADTIAAVPTPAGTPLPTVPRGAFPVVAARAMTDTAPYKVYERFQDGSTSNFRIWVITPVAQLAFFKEFERQISKDRRRREARANLSEAERYNEYEPYREWVQYVGDAMAPAIAINIFPKQGETGGSFLRTSLVGGRATYRFKGDLQAVRVIRNGQPVTPAVGGRDALRVFFENRAVQMKDVAYQGYYIFGPDLFEPDSTGIPPAIQLEITDLKNPGAMVTYTIPPAIVARAWNDFGPWYASAFPDRPFPRAVSAR